MRMLIQIYPSSSYTICSCDIFRYNDCISLTFDADGNMKLSKFKLLFREKNYEKIVTAQYLTLVRFLCG